jgi:hypothetical protein
MLTKCLIAVACVSLLVALAAHVAAVQNPSSWILVPTEIRSGVTGAFICPPSSKSRSKSRRESLSLASSLPLAFS